MMSKRDYDALMSGKQLLENNQYTTPIGRSIDLVSGRWDGNRAVVALYEASNILDTRDKDAVEDYIMESSIFLNRLNEKCHIDGYHFDMDDSESGKIYFGKDIDGNREGFNSSEDEVTYSQEAAYFTYLRNKDICQQRVNRMIEESLILTDDQMAISEKVEHLLVVNEGITDKVSDAWNKFKGFINKIWNKFLEFISRTVNSDKNYLEKYKEIILKRDFKVDGFEVDDDYHTGIVRISNFQIWSPNVEEVNNIPDGDDDASYKKVQTMIMKEYGSSSTQDFKDYCLTYFKGGTGTRQQLDKSNLRMSNLYDYCYNFDKIKRSIDKNRGIMDKAGNAFIELAKQQLQQNPNSTTPTNNNSNQNQGNGTGASSITNIPKDTNVTITKVSVSNNTGTVEYTYKDKDGKDQQGKQTFSSRRNQAQVQSLITGTMTVDQLNQKIRECDIARVESSASGQENMIGNITVNDATNNRDSTGKTQSGEYQYQLVFKSGNNTFTKNIKSNMETVEKVKTKLGKLDSVPRSDFDKIGTTVNEFYQISGSLGLISIYEDTTRVKSGDTGGIKVNTTASNFGNASTGQNMVRTRAGVQGELNDSNKNADTITKKVHKYTTVASTVFATILQAAETIKKDYMKIIKAHVRSYVGETDEERREGQRTADSPENYGTNTYSMDDATMNDLKNKIAEYEKPETQANRKTELEIEIRKIATDASKDNNGVANKAFESVQAVKNQIEQIENAKKQQTATNANATQSAETQ